MCGVGLGAHKVVSDSPGVFGSHIAFSCHVLVSVSLWQFFSLLICHALDTFVKYWSSILCNVLKVGLSDVLLWLHWGYRFYFSFFRNSTEMMCPFWHRSRVHDISMSYYLIVLNLIMWLRWQMPVLNPLWSPLNPDPLWLPEHKSPISRDLEG